MGRLGDSDVHSAFVEFKQKEADKCLSAQCLYCNSVRAKNTSRQRSHLLECGEYLSAMRQQNPNNPILQESMNPQPPAHMNPNSGSHSTPKSAKKRDHDLMLHSAAGYQGETMALRGPHVPIPRLERDFQISIQLNPKLDLGESIWGQRQWVSYVSGHWAGTWGRGTVSPGGQDSQTVARDLSTHVSSHFLLQTNEVPPALLIAKSDGWRVGPRDVLERLQTPAGADDVDPKSYLFRTFLTIETGDVRYTHLNTVMWLCSGIRRNSEVILDAYRVM